MTTNFNLSEKMIDIKGKNPFALESYFFNREDVREFIRNVREMIEFEVKPLPSPKGISNRLNSQIDKLAGEKLTK